MTGVAVLFGALVALVLALVPFVLPIASVVMQRRMRRRLVELEQLVAVLQRTIGDLERGIETIAGERSAPTDALRPVPAPPRIAAPPMPPAPAPVPPAPAPVPSAPAPAPPAAAPPPASVPSPAPLAPPPAPTLRPAPLAPSPADVTRLPHATELPRSSPSPSGRAPSAAAMASESSGAVPGTASPGSPPIGSPAPGSPADHALPAGNTVATPPRFDWESVVGVKLFSAVAGIALVLAAIFFLKYSIDHGWLAPPVRVVIGVIVATGLLVVCERQAARQYPVTANALDGAAVGILFATFLAAHAPWHLISGGVTFGLLALVTVLAVVLSIRRDSRFIALLGLAGGFATPALLSTGENHPIPLFTYLLLLNMGLASVGYRRQWPVLTVLTLVLTTLYQWGWVLTFLTADQLSLAMGIFLLFSVTSFGALTLGRRVCRDEGTEAALARSSVAASAMPLVFAVFLAAVPPYGAQPALLFGFLLLSDLGLLALALARREGRLHAMGAGATVVVFAIWLATSYAASAWHTAVAFAVLCSALYAVAPAIGGRIGRALTGVGDRAIYAAPVLLFVFPVIARIEPATADPRTLFGAMFVVLAVIAWRALASGEAPLYYMAAFFGLAGEASWSATHLVADRVGSAVALYAAFAAFFLGVPIAWRRRASRPLERGGNPRPVVMERGDHPGNPRPVMMEPRWGGGAVLMASLYLLLYLAAGPHAAAAIWGLALLLATLDAGLFIEAAMGNLPVLSAAGGVLSWLVLSVWWGSAAASVGVLPSLLVLVGLTLVMLAGHAWARTASLGAGAGVGGRAVSARRGFRNGLFLGLGGQLFLVFVALDPAWSVPPWPLFGALAVMTLAASAASLAASTPALNASGVAAAAAVMLSFASVSPSAWSGVAVAGGEAIVAYGLLQVIVGRRTDAAMQTALWIGLTCSLFLAELTAISASSVYQPPGLPLVAIVHVANISLILALAWQRGWAGVAAASVAPAWMATLGWQARHGEPSQWTGPLALSTSLYLVFAAYPFFCYRPRVLTPLQAYSQRPVPPKDQGAREARGPSLTAILGSVFFLFAARTALLQGGLSGFVGLVPILEGAVLAVLLRRLLTMQPEASRDLGRVAMVAGAALAFATVAIPLQLQHQWITIGWALEGAALSGLYRRVSHRGLFLWGVALLAVAFMRLALNPAIFVYEPRGVRVFNWYLYTYATCAGALFLGGWWLSKTDDGLVAPLPRASSLLPACGVILLFLVLNIEIADFYATGPEVTFRFGATLAQDLTYTIGWLVFGLGLLAAGISLKTRPGRVAAVALIAVTTCKAFLYDLGSLGGLYRVGSLVGLAISLALVALALQKFVLQAPEAATTKP